MAWNFGDILDSISAVLPQEAPALIHGDRVITWAETTRRSNNLGRALIARGARPGDKVAFYMRNRPEYVETMAACFKSSLVHVNINYRYKADEVFYIFNDSDAQTVVYGSEFRDIIVELKDRLTKVATFIEVNEDGSAAPFAENYEKIVTGGDGAPLGIERSPDDLLFIYTGGTTGMRNSLADGNYELTILSAQVSSPVSGLGMDSDFHFGQQAGDDFFRLLGDSDGDRDVDLNDMGAFGQTYPLTDLDYGFDEDMDFDGDGSVDGADFIEFRRALNGKLPF